MPLSGSFTPDELLVDVDLLPGRCKFGGLAAQQLPVQGWKLLEVVLPA